MRRADFIGIVAAGLLVIGFPMGALADTTVYLVRHAEKASGGADPELNEAGRTRADDLARVLRSAGIDQCFSTQYKRTKLTVAPVAKAIGKEVQVQKAGTERSLVKKMRDELKDQQVLIAGHSNTVPLMLSELGIADAPMLGESDYDDLFVVTIGDNGIVSYQHLHYGAANPK